MGCAGPYSLQIFSLKHLETNRVVCIAAGMMMRRLDRECVYYNSNGDLLPDSIPVYLRVEFDRI